MLILFSCKSKPENEMRPELASTPKIEHTAADNSLTFRYQLDFTHKTIINETDKKVDLLFNSVDGYLDGHRNPKVLFRTECIFCEPVQEFSGGLLFGKRLWITNHSIKYYQTDFKLPDSLGRLKIEADEIGRSNLKFNFKNGKGSFQYIGMSCNDADYSRVQLSYATGEIIVDSLINASLFEYDLDNDGQQEQYLLGSRNCSQELVLLRIR